MISKGFPDAARRNAEFNIANLHRFIEDGYSIVGCEPSCILTFRDEYPDLVKTQAAQDVAQASFLFEEFIIKEKLAGRWRLSLKPQPSRALIHGRPA